MRKKGNEYQKASLPAMRLRETSIIHFFRTKVNRYKKRQNGRGKRYGYKKSELFGSTETATKIAPE